MNFRNFYLLLCLTFVCVYQQVQAQSLKTFSDDYNDGKISYQYYEDQNTSEFIKHGAFKFIKNLSDDAGTYSETITGNFKNGYRDGAWNFSINKKDFPNSGGSYTTETTSSTQTFKDGIPNGVWKVNSTWKSRHRYSSTWRPFGETHTETASTFFVNGRATGLTTYTNPRSVTVNLNKDGFLIGTYTFPGVYENAEISCNQKGIVTKFISRSKAGDVKEKIEFDKELLDLADRYLSGHVTNEVLLKQNIRVDTISAQNYLNFGNLFERDYFLLPALGGDKSYDGSSSQSNRVYGRYILAQRIAVVPYESHPYWPTSGKTSDYVWFLEEYSAEISAADQSIIKQLILKSESENAAIERKKEYENEFQAKVDSIKKYFSDDQRKHYGDISLASNSFLSAYIIRADSLKNVVYTALPIQNRGNHDWDRAKLFREKLKVEEQVKLADKYLELVRKEYVPLKKDIYRFRSLAARADSAVGAVEKNVSGHPSLPKTTYQFYTLYKELVGYLVEKVKSSNQSFYENLTNVVLMSNKALEVMEKDNSEFLKRVKKGKDNSEKIKLFVE